MDIGKKYISRHSASRGGRVWLSSSAHRPFQIPNSKFQIPQRKALRGFSLIELLVVIAIIGVLSSIVMASLSQARLRSRDARRVTDLKQVQIALELYYDEFGKYPDEKGDSSLFGGTSNAKLKRAFVAMVTELNAKGYLPSSTVQDPLQTGDYYYLYAPLVPVNNKCKSYHLGAVLEVSQGSQGPLDSDADADINPSSCPPVSADFKGINSNNCSSASGVGNDRCYDLKP